jgi:hypothetical protein
MALENLIVKKSTAKAPRIILYGAAKCGKTTMASLFPNPVFIDLEDAFGHLQVESFPTCSTFADAYLQLEYLLNEKHDYETVIIDTIDKLESVLFADIAKNAGVKSAGAIKYGVGYVDATATMVTLMALLDKLKNKGIIVVLLAHNMLREPDALTDYKVHQIALHQKTARAFVGWADMLVFLRRDVRVETDAKGKNSALDTGKYVMTPSITATVEAGNRYGLVKEVQYNNPAEIVAILLEAATGKKKQHLV